MVTRRDFLEGAAAIVAPVGVNGLVLDLLTGTSEAASITKAGQLLHYAFMGQSAKENVLNSYDRLRLTDMELL